MKKSHTRKAFFCLLLAVSLTACVPYESATDPGTAIRPSFIMNPSIDNKIGGVGISRPHIRGISAQRELAISRAFDEIARQKGTKVKSWQTMQTTGTRDSASTHMEAVSVQTTSGEIIRAVIRQVWEDPDTNEIYVWALTQ